MLNSDQLSALKQIQSWWVSKDLYMILDGAGGTGKSHLLHEVINSLNCEPLLLCPTNEALKQLRDKVQGDYIFKTIHSALGIAPTTHLDEVSFEQVALPNIWDNINLCIVDECSMVSEELLKILTDIGKKILFVGHKSQLPPVKKNKGIFDKCVSPVFSKGYKAVTLNIPMRNKGELWDFNNHLEKMIYTSDTLVPNKFDIKKAELAEYINSTQGIKDVFEERTKFVLWSNSGVDQYNQLLREVIYGITTARKSKYIKGDKIILIKPLTVVEQLETYTEKALAQFATKNTLESLYSNTKAEVVDCKVVTVCLNKQLSVDCYKITVKCNGILTYFYELKQLKDIDKIENYYKMLAWNKKTAMDKARAFKLLHFMVSLFADIKHSYAQTAHRLQGSSIDTVIVIDSDIKKNMNIIEQKKCRYVATSRCINRLMFYRGN